MPWRSSSSRASSSSYVGSFCARFKVQTWVPHVLQGKRAKVNSWEWCEVSGFKVQTSVVLVWPWYQGSDPFYILGWYRSSYIYKLVGYESGMIICNLGCNMNMIQVLQSLAFIFWVYEHWDYIWGQFIQFPVSKEVGTQNTTKHNQNWNSCKWSLDAWGHCHTLT
jgi:hypothetical protein